MVEGKAVVTAAVVMVVVMVAEEREGGKEAAVRETEETEVAQVALCESYPYKRIWVRLFHVPLPDMFDHMYLMYYCFHIHVKKPVVQKCGRFASR